MFELNFHLYASDFSTPTSGHLGVTISKTSDCGATVSICVNLNIGLSITWLTKAMINKVCFVAKTQYHARLGHQIFYAK